MEEEEAPPPPVNFSFLKILLRLPVKSLLRFRLVSALWSIFIVRRPFIRAQLRESIENPRFPYHKIFLETLEGFWILSLPSLFNHPSTAPLPYNVDHLEIDFRNEEIDLVGSCDGLVCLLLDSKNFILWNPATKRSRRLPDPRNHLQLHNRETLKIVKYGFGFDWPNDDYKVFGIVMVMGLAGQPSRWSHIIYSVRTNTWTNIAERPPDGNRGIGMGMYVSGRLHWRSINANEHHVESFALNNHEYGVIEVPNYPHEVPLSLGVVRECLSAHFLNLDSDLDVWVMRDYGVIQSWVRVVTIPLSRLLDRGMPTYLDIRPTIEVLLVYNTTSLIYNPISDEFRDLQITGFGEGSLAGCSAIYIESLASIDPVPIAME